MKKDQRIGFILITLFAIAGLALVQCEPYFSKSSDLNSKLRAAHLAKRSFEHVAKTRLHLKLPFAKCDRANTGLIGIKSSAITSDRGYLQAKLASLNPNFAALIVHWLHQVGAKRGDVVAVALSGSFPALNICVYAALQTLGLEPLIITSAAASNWGSNDPAFCWLDMEKSLFDTKLLAFRSHLVSIGGNGDCGRGMSKEGVNWLAKKIRESSPALLSCPSKHQSIETRMAFYSQRAAHRPIRAYINVGGGIASVSQREKYLFQPGLNRSPPNFEAPMSDSVMMRFANRQVPLIHLVMIRQLADQYQLIGPQDGAPSPVGKSRIYEKGHQRYSSYLAFFVLILLIGGLKWIARWPIASAAVKVSAPPNVAHEPPIG